MREIFDLIEEYNYTNYLVAEHNLANVRLLEEMSLEEYYSTILNRFRYFEELKKREEESKSIK